MYVLPWQQDSGHFIPVYKQLSLWQHNMYIVSSHGLMVVLTGDNSSEEEDEELVFEEVVERNLSEAEAYDSSADNERDMFPTQRNRSLKLPFLNKPSRTVMSLLRRKRRKEQEPGDLVCQFLSSVMDCVQTESILGHIGPQTQILLQPVTGQYPNKNTICLTISENGMTILPVMLSHKSN